MTEHTPAVTISHPPAAILRVVNPALRFLLRTPLAGPAGKTMMVLNFTGRKSGRRYSVPVSAHQIGGDLYALGRRDLAGELPRRSTCRGTAWRKDDGDAR